MTSLTPEQPAVPQVPAGWYPDPAAPGTQRYWTGVAWSEHRAPLAPQVVVQTGKAYKTSHGFHLIMTILTFGLWGIFVWLPIGIYNAAHNGR